MSRDWTSCDAGLRSPALRALNTLGRLRPRWPGFEPAVEQEGLDDFRGSSFRQGLEARCEGIEQDADHHTKGRISMRRMFVGNLGARHPACATLPTGCVTLLALGFKGLADDTHIDSQR